MALYFKDKWWGKHIGYFDNKAGAHVLRTGNSVWELIGSYRSYGEDKEATLAAWRGHITAEELDAVLAYYQELPYAVDKKLWENEHDYPYIPELLEMGRKLESIQRQLAALRRRRYARRERIAHYSQRRRRPIR